MTAHLICALMLIAVPFSAVAHPHAFIDAKLQILFNEQGLSTGVRITWIYDPLTTLMMLEAQAMDRDFDGKLTEQESEALQGFDMNWQAGFEGDTYALLDASPLVLGPPVEIAASYAEERLISEHTRLFPDPVALAGQTLIVQSYDPEYYTAYVVADAGLTGGAGCKVQIFTPDLSQADIALQAVLESYGPDADPEADFPRVGAAYAEEARVTCPAP